MGYSQTNSPFAKKKTSCWKGYSNIVKGKKLIKRKVEKWFPTVNLYKMKKFIDKLQAAWNALLYKLMFKKYK